MTDESTKKDTLKVANPGKLSLTKTVESGKVKQNFTHGRSKSVTVEVKRTRTFQQGAGGMVEVKPAFAPAATQGAAAQEEIFSTGRRLTQDEQQARLKALKSAEETIRTAPPRKSEASPSAPKEEIEDAPVNEPAPSSGARREASSGIVRPKKPIGAEATALDKSNVNLAAPLNAQPRAPKVAVVDSDSEERAEKANKGKLKLRTGDERRNSGKLTVQQALSIEDSRVRSLASMRRQREKAMKKAAGIQQPTEKVFRDVVIPEAITVQEQ